MTILIEPSETSRRTRMTNGNITRVNSSQQDPADDESYGLAVLAHFRDGRFVGVDPGGCKVSGGYRADADGRLVLHLNYDLKAGVELANGAVFDRETRLEADLLLAPGAAEGAPQPVDFGLGPMFIRLNWLADPV